MVVINLETELSDSKRIRNFIIDTLKGIDELETLYKYMDKTSFSDIGYNVEAGVSEEDAFAMACSDCMNGDFSRVFAEVEQCNFGKKSFWEMLESACLNMDTLLKELDGKCVEKLNTLDTIIFTQEVREDYKRRLKSIIGNLNYGLYRTMNLDKIIDCLLNKEPYELDAKLKGFEATTDKKVIDIAKECYKRSKQFVPVGKVDEEYQHDWEKFIKNVPEEYIDDIIDYSEAIFLTDIVAVNAGSMKVDDSYVAALKARGDSDSSIYSQYPHEFREFQYKIPLEFSFAVTKYYNQIDINLVRQVLNGVPFDTATLNKLEADAEKTAIKW